jgi:small subunit ribosomal protein S14
MAKKSMREREIKRELLVKKFSLKRSQLRKKLKETNSFEELLELNFELQQLPRNSAPIRVRNRCWKTGRPRGFYRFFGLSRHVLREMAHDCLLPGVKKSSW